MDISPRYDFATRNELLAIADSIAPTLESASAAIEESRFLPQGIADELARAGLYRMLTPAVYGGHEADVHTFVAVIERLARANASAAWCAFISSTSAVIAAYLPEQEAKALFARPDLKCAGVFAPRGRAVRTTRDGTDGYVVNGRWQWGSGVRNADYVTGGCLVLGANGKPETTANGIPDVRSMLFTKDQVEIFDTWHTLGLRGTGSNEYGVTDLFVPASRSASMLTDKPLATPLYRFPIFGLLGVGIAAVALGIARSAVDQLLALANQKTPQGSGRLLAERPVTQAHVARAEARLQAARAFLLKAIDEAWVTAADDALPLRQRWNIRLATTHAVEEAAEIVDRMHKLAGGNAVFESSPVQRCLRDVHVASQHMMVSESTYELVGRLLLDLPTDTSML